MFGSQGGEGRGYQGCRTSLGVGFQGISRSGLGYVAIQRIKCISSKAALTPTRFQITVSSHRIENDTVSKRLHGANLTVSKCLRYADLVPRHSLSSRPNEISRQNSNRIQIDVVSPLARQMKPYRFEKAPLLSAFSNEPGFGDGLNWHRVNGRCTRIESDAVTNETVFV